MLKLHGKAISYDVNLSQRRLFILTKIAGLPKTMKAKYAFLLDNNMNYEEGYGAYISFDEVKNTGIKNHFHLPIEMNYLAEGDVIKIEPSGGINSLFRKNSSHNTILLTEQCNHYCLMCSQPPKNIDDSWLMDDTMELLELIPRETVNIGFSGGEPTLYGDRFVELINKAKLMLPNTSIDVLSNGRAFSDLIFTAKYATINHPNCVIGIPIYSDDPVRHDYVVQAEGAFDETIRGILNLKKYQQKVEIRIVIHKQTIGRLVQTCEFIARNLLFVDHVALMGLEMMGFTRANLDQLWLDPFEYKNTLSEAVEVLNSYGINTSVYNHQLCIINDDVLPNYKKSISDWKNEYVDQCQLCVKKPDCGGFFSSSKLHRYSDHIRAFSE
jgi:His-Xaa-Ser system radical SAM maturase HxsC